MKSSYKKEDVTLLLKDIPGLLQPEATEERERQIQAGRHYSEMLPLEYVPSEEYMRAYYAALESCAEATAAAVGGLADRIIIEKGREVVLVSLARAGIPIGILLKRYLKRKYDVDVPHYTISIIRGRGIDKNAIAYLLERYAAERLLFVDGWIGKGAIGKELREAVSAIPLDRILVETDAPYLVPKNVPGLNRTNLPQNVKYVVKDLAKYMKVTEDVLTENARKNTERLFRIEIR